MPIYAAFIFAGTWGASRVLSQQVGALSWIRMDGNIIFSVYGSLFNTFFIGIAQQTFSLFQCYKHPNGKMSLRSRPSVICHTDEWRSMLAVALVSVLLFCGSSLAVFAWAIIVAPRRFADERFRQRWKFLFIRFRPTRWWWGLLMLFKGVWLSLTTVIFLYSTGQLAWLSSCLTWYLLASFVFLPWRSLAVSVLDIGMHANLLFEFFLLPFLAVPDGRTPSDFGSAFAGIAIIPLAAAGVVVYIQVDHFLDPLPLSVWEAKSSELSETFELLKGAEPREVVRVVRHLPWADIVTLQRAQAILSLELLGESSRPASSAMLGMKGCFVNAVLSDKGPGSSRRLSWGSNEFVSKAPPSRATHTGVGDEDMQQKQIEASPIDVAEMRLLQKQMQTLTTTLETHSRCMINHTSRLECVCDIALASDDRSTLPPTATGAAASSRFGSQPAALPARGSSSPRIHSPLPAVARDTAHVSLTPRTPR